LAASGKKRVLPDGRLKNNEMFSGTGPVAVRKCADVCATTVVVVVLRMVVVVVVVGAAELPPHDSPVAKSRPPAARRLRRL
jgi:hypothetical protein